MRGGVVACVEPDDHRLADTAPILLVKDYVSLRTVFL